MPRKQRTRNLYMKEVMRRSCHPDIVRIQQMETVDDEILDKVTKVLDVSAAGIESFMERCCN
ncbi:hypothetical protein ABDD95_07585 [Mucilaginibacter sp. PAMB04274]|uniref:hypothetical protein n=1 Tax=Mucilaginibacter sp. PAMB04274 TaxID=3138568 RepID=UPI0031F6049F